MSNGEDIGEIKGREKDETRARGGSAIFLDVKNNPEASWLAAFVAKTTTPNNYSVNQELTSAHPRGSGPPPVTSGGHKTRKKSAPSPGAFCSASL